MCTGNMFPDPGRKRSHGADDNPDHPVLQEDEEGYVVDTDLLAEWQTADAIATGLQILKLSENNIW